MTRLIGQLHKMQPRIDDPIVYDFVLKADDNLIDGLPALNDLLGATITLEHHGKLNCINCNREIKKTFNQGYCFPCVQRLAACDLCIVKPANCHFSKGTCREPEWAKSHCFKPHIVYLANSSGIKVGVTREINIPYRWIDQGAVQSLAIMRVNSRYQAGLIEQLIAKHINDKTDWRKMLRSVPEAIDLFAKRDELFSMLAPQIQKIASQFKFGDIEILTSESVNNFNYPILAYPQKINSLCFNKQAKITDKLLGIKGQYLIFQDGVINLRKYTGYEISLEY